MLPVQLLAMQSFFSNHLITIEEVCELNISSLCDCNFNLNKLCFPTFYNGLNNLISQILNELELLTSGLKYNKHLVNSSSLIHTIFFNKLRNILVPARLGLHLILAISLSTPTTSLIRRTLSRQLALHNA